MGDHGEASSRPSIGFPLGLALLLLLLFFMSAFFSCCLHWDKIRSLFQSSPVDVTADIEADLKPLPPQKMPKQAESHSLTVLMPGDQVPKFIAMACPCRPPLYEKGQI